MPLVEKTINDLVDLHHKDEAVIEKLQAQVTHRGETTEALAKVANPSFDVETAAIFTLVGTVLGFIGAKVIH